MTTWIKELDEESGELRIDRAIAKLRDEVTGVAMTRHRGQNRELSLVMTKLDEARLWAEEYLQTIKEVVLVNRGELLRDATDRTDKTDREGAIHV